MVWPVTSGSVTAEVPTMNKEEDVAFPLPPFQSYEIVYTFAVHCAVKVIGLVPTVYVAPAP